MYKLQMYEVYSKKWVDGAIRYNTKNEAEKAQMKLKKLHNINSRILKGGKIK